MSMGARMLALCTCLAAAAANTSGALVSSIGELQQHQQRQPQQQEVVGVVENSRHGDSRLGGTASSRATIGISHSKGPAQAAVAAAARGKGIVDDGETADPQNAREGMPAVSSAAREGEPRGNRQVRGARRVPDTIMQGVRNDDRNEATTQVPEEGDTAARVAVIAVCIGAAIFFLLGWCWLSSLVVCVSWCVCKCANPSLGEGSSSGDNDLKHVDGYANAVRATFCGNLASVVCVSDEEAAPTSQPCTPLPGNDNIVHGSLVISSNNSDPNDAASATSDRAATVAPAANDAAKGTGSNQSAFSAIFRRYLTATAVPPATPASNATTHDPQYQPDGGGGNVNRISTAFCSTATDGGESGVGGVGVGVPFRDEEEKLSENAAVVAPPQSTIRPGLLGLFRNGSGNDRSESDGARGGRARTGWRARVWARLRSVGGGAGGNNPAGSGQDAAAGVPSDIGSPERSSEGRLQIDTNRRGASVPSVAGSLQVEGEDLRTAVDTMSHRRRTARRLAGSRGRSCGGESQASGPAVRDDGRNHGGDVAAGLESDGGGADLPTSVAGSGTRVGNHDSRATTGHLRVPETAAAGAAVGAVAAENAPSGCRCSDGDGEAGGAHQEAEGTMGRRTGGRSLAGGGVVAARARHPEGKGSGDAGKNRGGGEGEAEIEVGKGEDCVSSRGEMGSKSPVLPRARVLWRAFSEVDHDTITENHRRAGLRHLARFAPAPGIENPPMCYVPPQG